MNQTRNVTIHAIDGGVGDMGLMVIAYGEYSPGGAQNRYLIGEIDTPIDGCVGKIDFQDGNPADGVNGVTLEAVLAVCFDRLECFQKGPYANPHNTEALHHIERAIEALKDRTRERDRKEGAAQ